MPGERIGAPLTRGRRRTTLRGGVVVLIALGGAWAYLGDHWALPQWPPAWTEALFHAVDKKAPAKVETAALAPQTSPLPPLSSIGNASTPNTSASPAPLTLVNPPAAAKVLDEPAVQYLPPPVAAPADTYQLRAAAAGLHPDLSRVLLERLSPADYHNAAIAIQTAIAETSDTDVYVWPRQRTPELALFQVRFVAGAAPSCRRYVVTVTKAGWLTTALPMEKCGSTPSRAPRE